SSSEEKIKVVLNHSIVGDEPIELNGNSWVYFNYPQISKVKETAINDVQLHGINTFPLPRDILAKINGDIDGFREYMNGIPKKANILLFLNFSQENAKRIG